jgi:hypothetical protein
MGIFNGARQSHDYVPPIGGSNNATLLGGLSDSPAEPVLDGRQYAQAPNGDDLPASAPGDWRIEMRYKPLAHRGHAFLALIDPDGKTQRELHGLAFSRTARTEMPIGVDGSRLIGHEVYGRSKMGRGSSSVGEVAQGSYDKIVREAWARGVQAKDEINRVDFDYKGHDPSYELGGDGGRIQNSNSVAYTYGKAMGLDLDKPLREAGMERRFSGWGRNLLDPNYKRYVAPPVFPVANTP